MNSSQFIKFNVVFFVFYALSSYWENNSTSFQAIRIFLGFSVIFISGLDLAILVKIVLKRNFDFLELINLTFLNIIISIPILLFIENLLLKRTYPIQSAITLSLIIFITIFTLIFNKERPKELFEFPDLSPKIILSNQLIWIGFLQILLIFTIVFLYKFLPDKDPFTWYVRLTQYLESNALSEFSYRPLFYSIAFLFNSTTGVSIFIFLKYIVPFLFLAAFFPVWMIARKITNPRKRFLILLVPFLAPNTILYSLMGMPQTFFMILLYYFVFFLFYSYLKKDKFYFYVSGIISVGCTLYHEAGVIVLFVWLIVTLINNWKKIISNKKDIIFLLIIIISNLSAIRIYANFVLIWMKEIFKSLLSPHFNYAFPLKFIDINGLEAGSQNFLGVVKTYLGYIGPAIIFITISIIYLLISKKISLKKYFQIFKKTPELQIIILGFLIFFCIAEIMPRFPGIALLPDRAWIFASIFFSFFILFLAFERRNLSKRFFWIYIICISLSIFGAIYSNNNKKNLITDDQMKSAEWIKNELPSNRIIIADGQYQLLKFFSQSKVFNVNEKFFYDSQTSEKIIKNLTDNIITGIGGDKENDDKLKKYAENITSKTSGTIYEYLNSKDIQERNEIIQEITSYNIELSKNLRNEIEISSDADKPIVDIYIYYTNDNKGNFNSEKLIPNQEPGKFKKIYSSYDKNIIIWKVL